MHVCDVQVAGGFEPPHRLDEDIATNSLRGIFENEPAKCAAMFDCVIPFKSAAAGITKGEGFAALLVGIDASVGVADPPTRWQFHMKETVVALKCDARSGELLVFFALDGVDGLSN